ncbi:MAG TPA: phosphate ABC transporter permease PstA [Candidatus Thermoplasmatota archaeon]|nr:phosphate ABC transporter permease PstA [Candidatus Thermoplasmatota archaeon]
MMDLASVSPRRRRADVGARVALAGLALLSVAILLALLATLVVKGAPGLTRTFFTQYPSRFPSRAGALPAIVGTLLLGVVSMAAALPVGIAAAVYLHEFARANRVTTLLRASIGNLAGVPSVVFGILGLALFVRALMLGRSLLAAGLTLALLTLPIIIVVCEEALKTVPRSVREAAFALGATRWQAVRHHVLPYALPGMLTGSILALSRSMGETAPLILIGAAVYIARLPTGLTDSFTALPIQAYYWAQDARAGFHDLAWAAVLLLLILVAIGNLAAILLRDRYQRRYRW